MNTTDEVFSSVTGSHHVQWIALIPETTDGTMAGTPVYGVPFLPVPPAVTPDKRHRIGANVGWRLGVDWKKKKMYEMGSRSFYTVIPTELDVHPKVTFSPCGDGWRNLMAAALGITGNVEANASTPKVSFTMIAKVYDETYTYFIIQTGLLVNSITYPFDYSNPPEVTVEFVGQWSEFDADGIITAFKSKTFIVSALAAMTDIPLGPKDNLLQYSTVDPDGGPPAPLDDYDSPAHISWPTISKATLSINNNFTKQPCAVQGADTAYRAVASRYVPGELEVQLALTMRQYQNTSTSVLPDRNMYDYLANNSLARVKLTVDGSYFFRLGRYWTGAAAAGNPSFWFNPPDHGFKVNSPELERSDTLIIPSIRASLGTLWA